MRRFAILVALLLSSIATAQQTLFVPSQYATIQAAINAAASSFS